MTAKERVWKTFCRVKSDRMPINFFSNSGVLEQLCKHFHTDYYGVLDALNVDFRCVAAPYIGKDLYPAKEGMIVDKVYGFYAKWIAHATGGYWDYCYYPLQNAEAERIAAYPLADPNDFDFSVIEKQLEQFSSKAIYVGGAGTCDIINATTRVMGMEQTLINLQIRDPATLCYIQRRNDMELKILEKILQKAKGRVDFLWFGEDLGTQIAPMIGLDLYREVIKPLHKKYVDLAKSYNLKVMTHTCGSSSWAYEDFIELGIDAVDTLQPEAVNMCPQYLIEKFGGRLSFHGSISTAGALAYGTPQEVEKDVKEKCDLYRDTYSYMIAPTHCIQDNSPLQNVLSLYEAAIRYGKY